MWNSFLLGTKRSRRASCLFGGKYYSWKGGGFLLVLGLVLVGVFWLRNDLGWMGLLIVLRSCRDGRYVRSVIVLLVWVMLKRDFATCVWWFVVFNFVFCDFWLFFPTLHTRFSHCWFVSFGYSMMFFSLSKP